MSRVFRALGLLVLLPYGYVGYYWLSYYLADCAECQMDGHMLFYSFVLLCAAPFLMAGFGLVTAVSAARAARANISEKQPVRAATSGGVMWLAVLIAVPALYTAWEMYGILFPDVEEGRDRLGRICTKEGNSTVCRPDPARVEAMNDQYNRKNYNQRGFQ